MKIKRNQSYISNVLGFMLLTLLFACGNPTLYDKNIATEDPWNYSSKIDFEIEVTDTITPYDVYINIRNTVDYSYSNIHFFIKTKFPNGKYAIDTTEIFLADIKGNWLGKGLGKNKDSQVLYQKKGRFPMKGIYKISFEHAMRDTILRGIKSVGLRIEESE